MPYPGRLGSAVLRFLTLGYIKLDPKSWLAHIAGVLILLIAMALVALLIVIIVKMRNTKQK